MQEVDSKRETFFFGIGIIDTEHQEFTEIEPEGKFKKKCTEEKIKNLLSKNSFVTQNPFFTSTK